MSLFECQSTSHAKDQKENAYLENLGRFHVCLCEQIDASVTRVKVVTDHRSSDGIRENLQTCLFAQTVILEYLKKCISVCKYT